VFEDVGVQAGDVDGWKDGKSANDDGPEQELVLPDVMEEWELASRVAGIEGEHASSNALELPSRNQNQPGEFGEDCSSGAEDDVAGVVVAFVAVFTEAVTAGTVDDEDKRHQATGTLDGAVDEHVSDELPGEDSFLVVMWRALHDVRRGFLTAKAKGREGGREHVNPQTD